jgi:CRP-like cAMP-binding protein
MTFSIPIQLDSGEITLRFEKGSFLPVKKYPLWQIRSGLVKTSTVLEDGTVVVLGLWEKNNLVGRVLSKADPYQVECLTQVTAVPIKLENNIQFTELLLQQIKEIEELTIIRSHKKIDLMLLKLLAWFAEKHGSLTENGHLIDLRLTHQDLADILGTTRVTITRALGYFEQQGIITRLPLHRIVLHKDQTWHYQI